MACPFFRSIAGESVHHDVPDQSRCASTNQEAEDRAPDLLASRHRIPKLLPFMIGLKAIHASLAASTIVIDLPR